jgi:catechol 2,3-dioxygenase-like lactoylglutathione lyase family enzyme
MPRIDHVAVETPDPDKLAAFYEGVLRARLVTTEDHPVMAYVGTSGFAFHGPGGHTGIRVSEEERNEIRSRLDAEGIQHEERDHGVGLFFHDPEGRLLEAITYRGDGSDPRR